MGSGVRGSGSGLLFYLSPLTVYLLPLLILLSLVKQSNKRLKNAGSFGIEILMSVCRKSFPGKDIKRIFNIKIRNFFPRSQAPAWERENIRNFLKIFYLKHCRPE